MCRSARKKEPMPEQLRPITPIKLKAVAPGPIGKDIPKFEMVDPTSLLVEPSYQRDTSNSSLKPNRVDGRELGLGAHEATHLCEE
jgi:hypothetical protein